MALLNPKQLINDNFTKFSRKLFKKKTVKYHISTDSQYKIGKGRKIEVIPHSSEWQEFIDSAFGILDSFLKVKFKRVKKAKKANLQILQVEWVDGLDTSAATGRAEQKSKHWLVQYQAKNNYKDNSFRGYYDANTFIHELGHTLGLSHPKSDQYPEGSGFNPLFTTLDTAMSYNLPPDQQTFIPYFFTRNDLLGLGEIWGFRNSKTEEIVGKSIFAGPGNDTIFGEAGEDILWGMEGDDLLIAQGTGTDILIGGKGQDSYFIDGPAVIAEPESGEEITLGQLNQLQINSLYIQETKNSTFFSIDGQTILTINNASVIETNVLPENLTYKII